MDQSNSTVASQSSDLFEEIVEDSPRIKGWVNDHFSLARVDEKRMRICSFDGCGKMYCAGSSTNVLKKHWRDDHEQNTGKKTRFLFADALHTNQLLKMVIDLHLDYSIVDKPSFREFVRTLNPNKPIICRQTLSDLILRKRDIIESMITDALQEVNCLALTFDIWSPRQGARGFGTITAHFVKEEGKLSSLILQFRRLKYPHNKEAISNFLAKTISTHKLEEKIVSLTTDSASENISAVEALKTQVNLGLPDLGFTHYRCVAHIIDLGIRDAIKNLRSTVNDVRSAILAIKSSTKRSELFQNIQAKLINQADQRTDSPLQLIEDVDHRWNSSMLMLERAFKLRNAIDELLSTSSELRRLNIKIDWQVIETVIIFLKPFHDSTKRLCVEDDCNISVVSYVLPKLIEHCQKYCTNSEIAISQAAGAIAAKLSSYLSELYKPIVNMAYVLDPRYKTKGLLDETVAVVKDQLRSHLESTQGSRPVNTSSRFQSQASIFLDDSDNENEPLDELEDYLSARRERASTNAYEYWKLASSQYPKLSVIARKILSIQATSVASERVFSIAGNIDSLSRNRLLDRSVECNVLFKSWMQFLNLE